MRELLPKSTEEYRARAHEVAEKAVRPIAAELDRTGEYPWSVVQALRDAGLMGLWIPREYGGGGAGVLDLCVVVEELSICSAHRLTRTYCTIPGLFPAFLRSTLTLTVCTQHSTVAPPLPPPELTSTARQEIWYR